MIIPILPLLNVEQCVVICSNNVIHITLAAWKEIFASSFIPSEFKPVSLYSSSPDNYRNRESFYHVIIPSAQWSWRWVYWFHLVRPSPHYSPCCSPRYGWDAENWECGNILRVISALWLKCGDNAEISPYSCPNTPIRIFSAFPPHFFPYRNAEKYAEISPRSCPNTPIRIFSAFFSAFFAIQECGDFSAFLSEYSHPHFLRKENAEIWGTGASRVYGSKNNDANKAGAFPLEDELNNG